MKTAVCLGGADCLPYDLKQYKGPRDAIFACNDAIPWFEGDIDAAVSLHPEKMLAWLWARKCKGHPDVKSLVSYRKVDKGPKLDLVTDYLLPGQKESGSSGLYMAKVALMDMGFDRVVFCGVPLTRTPHIEGSVMGTGAWHRNDHYARTWLPITEDIKGRMASMSGWTREFLGGPEKWS